MNTISTQRGSALIIALVILALMTMLSLAGMQTTILQEKMAGNLAGNNAALQTAEAALRQAEALVRPLEAEPPCIPPCQVQLGGADAPYIIEYYSHKENSGEGSDSTGRSFFRITAWGTNAAGTARVTLQSMYAKRFN